MGMLCNAVGYGMEWNVWIYQGNLLRTLIAVCWTFKMLYESVHDLLLSCCTVVFRIINYFLALES